MNVTCVYKYNTVELHYNLTFLTSKGWIIMTFAGTIDYGNKVWTHHQLDIDKSSIIYEQT